MKWNDPLENCIKDMVINFESKRICACGKLIPLSPKPKKWCNYNNCKVRKDIEKKRNALKRKMAKKVVN